MTTVPPLAPPYMAFAVRWTRDDCKKLEAAGVLNYRYELIEGVIIRTSRYLPHAMTVNRAANWLNGRFGDDHVATQASITVAPNETAVTRPEPDVCLFNKPSSSITTNQPRPEDIAPLIEVPYSTLDCDLQTKAGVYARAKVPQYLVIDVNGRVVYDHTLIAPGVYDRQTRTPGDAIVLLAAPQLALTVDDLLLP